ncbi:MAG: hypothetical protein U0575_17265 [Phycisphaerales bacterium]
MLASSIAGTLIAIAACADSMGVFAAPNRAGSPGPGDRPGRRSRGGGSPVRFLKIVNGNFVIGLMETAPGGGQLVIVTSAEGLPIAKPTVGANETESIIPIPPDAGPGPFSAQSFVDDSPYGDPVQCIGPVVPLSAPGRNTPGGGGKSGPGTAGGGAGGGAMPPAPSNPDVAARRPRSS